MVFVGKVTPRYLNRGALPNRLGSFELTSKAKELPLRAVYYTGPEINRYVSWQSIDSNQAVVSSDSVIELSPKIIDSVIRPQNDLEGGVLLHRGQLQEKAWGILNLAGERLRSDLEQYCRWIVLLPGLERDRDEAFGFDLAMSGAANNEINSLLRGFTDDVVDLHDGLVFINPYYGGRGFFFGGFEMVREMSSLVGGRVVRSAAAGLNMPLRPEVADYFAAVYARLVAEDFLDISLVYGLLDHEEKYRHLSGLDNLVLASRGGISSRESTMVNDILKG